MDVHKNSIVVSVADSDGGVSRVGRIDNTWTSLKKVLKRLGPIGSLFCCYEAGPTGYDLYRKLTDSGFRCIVVAPSLIPKKPGERVKTDQRDACNLARLLRSGDLTPVWVPDEETEAMRDLVRARDDAKKAERVARQQLGKFLLRLGRRYPGKTAWTGKHLDWIRGQEFDQEAQQIVLLDYIHTLEEATRRVHDLDKAIASQQEEWSRAPLVKALQAFRGISLVTAVGIVAEIGDFQRFATAPKAMSFAGLTPSEHSSGDSTRRGGITRAGNRYVRRLLVESAWSYRFTARMSPAIRKRNQGVPAGVRTIAWKAQKRLCKRYRQLLARGKTKQKTVTAVARELMGFIWAASQELAAEGTESE
jgi:transposase